MAGKLIWKARGCRVEVIVEPTTLKVLVRGGWDWPWFSSSSWGSCGGVGAEEPGTELGAVDEGVLLSGRETEVIMMCGMA